MTKARLLYVDNSIETFDFKDEGQCVVLSTCYKEDFKLLRLLEKLEYEVAECEEVWPRDHYAYHNNNYIRACDLDSLGEGGFYAYGRDYVIISESAIGRRDDIELLENFLKANVHTLDYFQENYNNCTKHWEHIDLTVLPIPQREIIFVDNRHYVQQKKRLHEIAEIEKQKLVPIVTASKKWPLNSLVLEKEGEAIVITNSLCKMFTETLKKHDIRTYTVRISKRPGYGGSIRCATNITPSKKFLEEVLEVELK
ncbi:MAG: hypothetical protein ABIB71_04655 [Candidatus Woesearchaeota archaeon]